MMQRETRNRAFVLTQDIRQDAARLSRILAAPETAAEVDMSDVNEVFMDLTKSMENLRKSLGEAFE